MKKIDLKLLIYLLSLIYMSGLDLAIAAEETNLRTIFVLAKQNDAKFATATQDRTLNQFQSTLAYSAYAPSLNYNLSDYTTGTVSQQSTLSITQPILSLEKIDQLRQGAPKANYAEAVYMTQEQDLASRVYSAVANLITQNQSVESNNIRINTLEKQLNRAARLIELGFGTVTDERDIRVRYEQAIANRVTLEINRRNAVTQIMTLTKASINAKDFILPESHELKGQFEITSLLDQVMRSNPNLIAARSVEEISSLEAKRLRDQIFPTISVTQQKRFGDLYNDNVTVFNLSMPLDASRVIGGLSSSANEAKAYETRRQVEEQTTMLTNQLYESVVLGKDALNNKKKAVEAAKLSVEANEKSSIAGVRTTIEVLNSIDTLYQIRTDYAATAVSLGNSYLNLMLIAGTPPLEAVSQTQNFLFGTK